MRRHRSVRLMAAAVCLAFVAGACSSDDEAGDDSISGGDTTPAASSPVTEPPGSSPVTEPAGDTTAPVDTDAPDDTATVDTDAPDTTAAPDAPDTTGAPDAPPGAENVGVEGGSGCGIPHGPYDDPGDPSGEVRVAWNDPLLSFNSDSSRGNATANNNPLYLMNSGFSYYDGDLNYMNNDQFGTCTIESLDPLTVTFRINEGVTWSDGTPVDAADMILYWGATGTHYNDTDSVILEDGTAAAADADGNPIVLDASGAEVPYADVAFDPDTGALPEGFTYKPSTGVLFDASSESLELVTGFPEISEDGLAATITWDTFYVDYQLAGLDIGVPAHVVAMNALGITDPMEAKQAIIDAFQNDDAAALKPIAEFWNTGFDATSLPEDPSLFLSTGAYLLTSYEEVAQMTFEANPDYTWGPQPQVETIVYRIIGDPTAAVQALENEEIDIIQPQATADILTQLQGLADRGVEVLTGNAGTYEHVDLAVNNGGPFDPAAYGGDEETALKVRQAFLKTIPRQDIVDRLIVPLNPDATPRGSFTTVVGAPTYEGIIAENGSTEYADVDIEGAIALLEEAGVTTPVDVRLLFAENNPRRANEYDLISASAAEAGFNVIDGRSPTWGQQLPDTSIYDASLFGWQSTSVDVAGTEANFVTGGQNNYGGYSSEVVDGLYETLKGSTDPDEQQQLLLDIEKELWADAFGVTLFQHPGITAFNSTYVSNVSALPIAPTVFHNFWEWQAA